MNATPGSSQLRGLRISQLPHNTASHSVRLAANRDDSPLVQIRRCIRKPELGGRPVFSSLSMRVHTAATAEPVEPRQADATDGGARPRCNFSDGPLLA